MIAILLIRRRRAARLRSKAHHLWDITAFDSRTPPAPAFKKLPGFTVQPFQPRSMFRSSRRVDMTRMNGKMPSKYDIMSVSSASSGNDGGVPIQSGTSSWNRNVRGSAQTSWSGAWRSLFARGFIPQQRTSLGSLKFELVDERSETLTASRPNSNRDYQSYFMRLP